MKKSIKKTSGKFYDAISSPFSLVIIFFLIVSWFVLGIYMHFSDIWYKFLEGFIIILTLLMVFVIEHNQHANTKAINEKLDELLEKHPRTDKKKMAIEKKYKEEV